MTVDDLDQAHIGELLAVEFRISDRIQEMIKAELEEFGRAGNEWLLDGRNPKPPMVGASQLVIGQMLALVEFMRAADQAEGFLWGGSPSIMRTIFDVMETCIKGYMASVIAEDLEAGKICPDCNGKGFLNPDGTPNNAFDSSPTIPCARCEGKGRVPWPRTPPPAKLKKVKKRKHR